MKTIEHTPGPWTISEVNKWQVIGPGASQICECFTPYTKSRAITSYQQVTANALLIAAAPRLLGGWQTSCQPDAMSGSTTERAA